MNEFQERQWIEAARRGDQDAFASLVHLYEKRVMALALRMCRSPEDAAEAAQEAFLAAWQGLPNFRGEASFSTWLYRLTSNACVDLLRREGRHRGAAGRRPRSSGAGRAPGAAGTDRNGTAGPDAGAPPGSRAAGDASAQL